MGPDARQMTGPFDIIGDLHGCKRELTELLGVLGYREGLHPRGRRLVFLGDLTDRGPDSLGCLQVLEIPGALYVPGNHCNKLYRYLKGNPVQVSHGLETTVAELEALSAPEREKISHAFVERISQTPPYLILDHGRLVVSHAGIRQDMVGKVNEQIRSFCLYGDVDGRKLPNGRPLRRDWAQNYQGAALVVYGHTPVREPRWVHNTVNIDQGCVFGGGLTALRYPERETVSVHSSLDPHQYEDNPLDEDRGWT